MPDDYTGFGALGGALQKMEGGGYPRVLVVASVSGWERFTAKGTHPFFVRREIQIFSSFGNNPDFSDILAGAARLRAFRPDLIVAIGGGSPIDVAKVMKAEVFSREPYDPARPESIIPSGDGPPLAAIATTAGSGSEATQYAVFYVGETKQSLSHPSIRPEIAVADPELSSTMPPGQTASTGFDALAQCVEAYWASSTSEEAQELAGAGIGYAVNNLYNAVTAPAPGSRYNMAQAAYISGKAINYTRTTIPHALAYHLTKRYGLPHGHAVAVTLPHFFILNMDPGCEIITPRGPEAHRRTMDRLASLLGQKTQEDCFHFWRNLMQACGLASNFADIGLTEEAQVRELVSTINPARMQNHPVRIETEYLVRRFIDHG